MFHVSAPEICLKSTGLGDWLAKRAENMPYRLLLDRYELVPKHQLVHRIVEAANLNKQLRVKEFCFFKELNAVNKPLAEIKKKTNLQ